MRIQIVVKIVFSSLSLISLCAYNTIRSEEDLVKSFLTATKILIKEDKIYQRNLLNWPSIIHIFSLNENKYRSDLRFLNYFSFDSDRYIDLKKITPGVFFVSGEIYRINRDKYGYCIDGSGRKYSGLTNNGKYIMISYHMISPEYKIKSGLC